MKAYEFVPWDKLAIQKSDLIFAYLEKGYKDNAMNLGFELGYATGLGKLIIFVTEKEIKSHELAEVSSDLLYVSLDCGMNYLDSLNSFDLTIYLAGSLRSGWQDKLLVRFSHKFKFLDPRSKE